MKVLVTGSAGHLGDAMVRTLRARGDSVVGVDIVAGPSTTVVGSIFDRAVVHAAMDGVDAVVHTATLHKPHVATHSKQAFIDTNITGTLNLLEEAVRAKVGAFVFTSTTSAFGAALSPPEDAPAVWIDETVRPVPKNIYGVTKTAAEDLCQLHHRKQALPCIVLRTSRFFLEPDDNREIREAYADVNAKANEFLFRRLDIDDVVSAHLAAIERAHAIGFAKYVISATTPLIHDDLAALRTEPAVAVKRRCPEYTEVYARLGYSMFATIDRVYDNGKARRELGWQPKFDFARVVAQLSEGKPIGSDLARAIGSRGYHEQTFADGPYPVD